MSDDSKTKTYPPSAEASANARISSLEQYRELCDRSISDPEGFWTEHAERLHWLKMEHAPQWDYHKAFQWFIGGKLNACYNCVDRHVDDGQGDDTALTGKATGRTAAHTPTGNCRSRCKRPPMR